MDSNQNSTKLISKRLNIIQINVNSLIKVNRRYDLLHFINANKPDLILLNETKLNTRHKVHFENYDFVRKDRIGDTRGGGTGILIKKGLKYKSYSNSIIDSLKCLETCILRIPLSSNKAMYVVSAYYPSGNNNEYLKYDIQLLFEALKLENPDNFYIIAGDLNSKHQDWGNLVNNPKGITLKDWLVGNDIKYRCNLYASVLPSYPRCGSFLDICIADNRITIQRENSTRNCLTTIDYDSDHNAIQQCSKLLASPRSSSFKIKRRSTRKLNARGHNFTTGPALGAAH